MTKKHIITGTANADRKKDRHVNRDHFDKPFRAFDGEGLTLNDNHYYVMMATDKGDHMIDPRGLSTRECLDFLLEHGQDCIPVCFSASYDINKILKDIPYSILKQLHGEGKRKSGNYVQWENYILQYRPRKCLFVGKVGTPIYLKKKNGDREINYIGKMMLWDVFGFFQSSFLKALEKYFTDDELKLLHYDFIKEGKDARGTFDYRQLEDFVLPYCITECKALVELMNRLRQYMRDTDIKVSRWDGAGAIAASIYKKVGIKKYHGRTPLQVEQASQHAYSGGRIELIQYGYYKGDIHHYDINSAYPAAMVYLPDLADGTWVADTKVTEHAFQMIDLSWNFPEAPFYPCFNRDVLGQICYPKIGRNWVWKPIYDVISKYFPDYVHVHRSLSFVNNSTIKPFTFVSEYYKQRLAWKEAGIGAEKVLKLGINSLYGKMAQQLGYNPETGKKPPYFQFQWAGYILEKTRATLYDAAMQSPSDIIAFSTDGLWSKVPLALPCGKSLGEWTYEKLAGGVFVQSGVYWSIHEDGDMEMFCRGYDKNELSLDKILLAWENKKVDIIVPCERFVTLGTALASEERFNTHWGKFVKTDRVMQLTAGGSYKRRDISQRNLAHGLRKTEAQWNNNIVGRFPYNESSMSCPYELAWEKDIEDIRDIDEGIALEIQDVQEM